MTRPRGRQFLVETSHLYLGFEGRVIKVSIRDGPHLGEAMKSFSCFVQIITGKRCKISGRGLGRMVPPIDKGR
jgi:hypothetical protein